MNLDEKRKYLKVPEVAEVLRIARSRAYELVAEGESPSIGIGGSVRVSRSLLRRSGLPDIRFHDLRHTCATLLPGK